MPDLIGNQYSLLEFREKDISDQYIGWLNNPIVNRFAKVFHIRQFLLGVSKDNIAAVKAYEKAGFVEASTPYINKPMHGSSITMVQIL